MFGYFLLSVFMILTGFALFRRHSQYAIFAPFRYVVEFFYWTGGNSIDIHSWHRLGVADRALSSGVCLAIGKTLCPTLR